MIDLWLERCRAVVARELKNRNWTLVSADDAFLMRVVEEIQPGHGELAAVTDATIVWGTVRSYTQVLYDACGHDGTASQRRAFDELWNYLYPHAVYQVHDAAAAEDALQETLLKILQKSTSCTDRASFLGWCDQVLRNVMIGRFRTDYNARVTERGGVAYEPKAISLLELRGEDAEGGPNRAEDFVVDLNQDILADALRGPMRDALLAALRDCLQNERQVAVIVELFLNDSSFVPLAQQLETTPLNIQVMKSRSLQKLRDCPEMQQLFEDWLQ